ncbi:MAG: sigma-70 family RNA polymerase sigma factor [Deltaproteobacteria bacterium]|nr:sigma-70 family RNA polymerase sigma factor [Deltaproteobacteria bacterium]
MEQEIDEVVLRRAIRGEEAAARAMVVMYQGRVFALVARMLAGRGKATIEDVAQDTFLHVFRQLPRFEVGGAAKVSTWILTIAARRAIDELRRKRPALVADVADTRADRAGADERARRREIVGAIEAALRELSPELRAAFLLREYHGLEYVEIAEALGIDLGTVKSRLSRARAALRERLAEVHDGR